MKCASGMAPYFPHQTQHPPSRAYTFCFTDDGIDVAFVRLVIGISAFFDFLEILRPCFLYDG